MHRDIERLLASFSTFTYAKVSPSRLVNHINFAMASLVAFSKLCGNRQVVLAYTTQVLRSILFEAKHS